MLAREAMSAPVTTVAHTATVREAVRVLYDRDVAAAPVVGDDGRLVGIVAEIDLLRGEFEADPRAFARPREEPPRPPRLVAEVMTTEVRTARPTSDVAALAEEMLRTGIRSVPVLDGGRIVGMVSRRDLLAALVRDDERVRADVRAALSELVPQSPDWSVEVADGVVEVRGGADDRARRLAGVVARTVPGALRVRVSL